MSETKGVLRLENLRKIDQIKPRNSSSTQEQFALQHGLAQLLWKVISLTIQLILKIMQNSNATCIDVKNEEAEKKCPHAPDSGPRRKHDWFGTAPIHRYHMKKATTKMLHQRNITKKNSKKRRGRNKNHRLSLYKSTNQHA